MTGQEGCEMFGDADAAHPGSPAAVGNTEGLVQVQVAHICANEARRGDSYLCVHIGAIHVHLASVVVDELQDVYDGFLEDAVGRRVGYHQRAQVILVLLRLGLQVININVSHFVALDHDDLHTAHGCTRRVGSMGGHGNQTHIPVALSSTRVVGADAQESGVFSLGPRVRLRRHRREACDLSQILVQVVDHVHITLCLVYWLERMHVRHRWPRDWQHFGGCIELHGTTTQRDHREIEGQILVLQELHVSKHLRL
mmetsp:Transcript_13/g.24  ORF Transcript_13/g.24 Transcript_13/m.24 type:complete len:254 (+) Transcript_13:782-1543(+)